MTLGVSGRWEHYTQNIFSMTISQKLASFARRASFAFIAAALLFTSTADIAFAVAPLAVNDNYSATMDVQLSVNALDGVLTNDSDDVGPIAAIAVVAGSTTAGGSYDLSTDGSFVYTPPSGYRGSDTFTYEVNDIALEGPSSATVEILVEDPAVANVATLSELNAALGNPAKTTINLTADISGITDTVVLNRALTLNGGGNSLSFTGLEAATPNDEGVTIVAPATINNLVVDAGLVVPATWVGTYAVQVYNSTATLHNVTATGANGGIMVNNSNVTLTGTVDVSGNGFGGIESSNGSVLTVSSASFTNTSEVYGKPTLWEDGLTGTTVVNYGSITRIEKGSQYQFYLSADNAKIPQTITFADPTDLTYGDFATFSVAPTADSSLLVSIGTSGACSKAGFLVTVTGAGTCTITATQTGDAIYAAATPVVQSVTISPRAVTVTAASVTKEYDTTTSSAGTPTLTAGSLAFFESATYSQTYVSSDVGVGIVIESASSLDSNANYAVTHVDGSGDITPASLTATAVAADKEYDGNTTTTAAVSVTPLAGDTVTATYTTAIFDTKDVGVGKTVTVSGIALDGADKDNYALTINSATDGADVTAKALTVDVTVDNKVYDNTTAATITGYTPVGLVGLETVTINGGVATFTDNENVGAGKPVSITGLNLVANAVSANYSFTTTDTTTANITTRAITVTAVTATKVYDGHTTSAGTPAITGLGLATGDTSGFSQVYDTANAGTGKSLSVAGAVNDGNGGNNYAVTPVSVSTGEITKAPLTITAQDKTKVYGDANPVATASYSGFVNSENESILDVAVTLVVVANNQTDVNNHPITAFGAADGNYAITHVNGNLEITKRPLTTTVVATDKEYDGTTDADVALTLNGVLFADVVTVSNTDADFDTKNVGTGKTVTATGVAIAGADAGNYSIAATATDTADITAAPLSVTANAATKVYGDADPVFTYTATGLVSGDSFTGALSRDAGEDVSDYAMEIGSLSAGSNYGTIVFTPADLSITKAPLTITADDKTRVYGNANPTFTLTYSAFQFSDDENNLDTAVEGYTVAGQFDDAGTYSIDVVEDGGGFGPSALVEDDNYELMLVSGTLTIERADQEITFDPLADMEFGDADFDVAATSDSDEDVVFSAAGACTVSGATVHLTTKGTCTITASVPASTNYNAAVSVDQSFEVADVAVPVITLAGSASLTLTTGDGYVDAGATATDDVDGDITASIVTVNPVNMDLAGTYTITYNVTDGAGNIGAEATRTVVVERRSSGGGGGSSRNTETVATGGRVLGAALYFFATDLTVGSTGADVMELQKVLIEAGYLKIAAPTGYFGPMTQAAVKLYQAAKGIQTTGYVGPLTRAALNQGTAPKTAEEQIADLMAQLKALQAQQ